MTHSVNTPQADELRGQLARWTAAGLIDAAQASRIEEAESARIRTSEAAQSLAPSPAAGAGARRRLPLVVEALGYLGAVIAIAAGVVAVQQYWQHIPASAELAFAGAAAVLLLAAGAVVKTGGEPAFARLRSVLWLLATASAASFTAVLAGRFGHMGDADTALLSSLAWTVCAVPLWWRERSALLHLSMFGGLLAAGVILRRVLFLGLGAVGVIWVVPHAVSRYLAGSAVAPFAVAAAGLVLAAIAVWLARARTRS